MNKELTEIIGDATNLAKEVITLRERADCLKEENERLWAALNASYENMQKVIRELMGKENVK